MRGKYEQHPRTSEEVSSYRSELSAIFVDPCIVIFTCKYIYVKKSVLVGSFFSSVVGQNILFQMGAFSIRCSHNASSVTKIK